MVICASRNSSFCIFSSVLMHPEFMQELVQKFLTLLWIDQRNQFSEYIVLGFGAPRAP
jgi:hypothetical protein